MPLHTNKNVEGEQMRSYPDIIAHLLTYALTMLPSVTLSQDEISAVSRQISLGFVGVIILSSVRFTLKAVSRVSAVVMCYNSCVLTNTGLWLYSYYV